MKIWVIEWRGFDSGGVEDAAFSTSAEADVWIEARKSTCFVFREPKQVTLILSGTQPASVSDLSCPYTYDIVCSTFVARRESLDLSDPTGYWSDGGRNICICGHVAKNHSGPGRTCTVCVKSEEK